MGQGGLRAYLGTSDVALVERQIVSGDEKSRAVFEAMIYQIAKEIGAMSCVLNGRVDNIILTGGVAHSKLLTDLLTQRVRFIAPVITYAGEFEMEALAQGVLRILDGSEKPQKYA